MSKKTKYTFTVIDKNRKVMKGTFESNVSRKNRLHASIAEALDVDIKKCIQFSVWPL